MTPTHTKDIALLSSVPLVDHLNDIFKCMILACYAGYAVYNFIRETKPFEKFKSALRQRRKK